MGSVFSYGPGGRESIKCAHRRLEQLYYFLPSPVKRQVILTSREAQSGPSKTIVML